MAHSSNRRHFLLSTLNTALYAAPFSGFLLNACKTTNRSAADDAELSIYTPPSNLTIRKSATDPSNAGNIELYRKAVAAMKATTFPLKVGGQDVSWWEAHAEIHNNFCPHGNWFFLPWHRGYLHYFERVCREFCGDPSFALPYWDWSEDSRLPEPFTTGDETSNSLFNATRSLTPRQALNLKECESDFIQGILDISDFATFAGGPSDRPRVIDDSIADEVTGFTGRLEAGPHNKVHATMQGDMGTFVSPRDAIFWLHHCNIDRLWTNWVAERTLKNQDILPGDQPLGSPELRLSRDYWLNSKIGGYYSIAKEGEAFKAAAAEFKVSDVYDAIKMGLAYQPYVKAVTPPVESTPTPQAPAATPDTTQATTQAPATPGVAAPAPSAGDTAVSKAVIPPPMPVTSLKSRLKAVVKTVITLKASFVGSFSLAQTGPATIRIASSAALESALAAAAKPRGNREATLRLVVRNIPFPTNPLAELHFYLNSNAPTGEESNPQFIGGTSFFGHKHANATVSTAFDLVPTVKKLVAANQKPFGSSKPLLITAVWKSNTKADDLSALTLSLDYLELG